ncbi:MAG TPA: hypothetical protein VFX61_10615 [Micromonosporaceae bacterium]|nr:hypothetical protein [Micromonosporaceae bacterium]
MSEQLPADVPEVNRARRWLLPSAGLAVLLLLIGAVTAIRSATERPPVASLAADPTPLAAPTATAISMADPTPTGTVMPATTPAPTPTARSTRQPAPTQSTSSATQRPSTKTTTPKPSCTPAGVVDVVQVLTYGVAKVAARTDGKWVDQLCPGERIRVFWATYSRTPDGGAKLYRSEARYLGHSQPTWKMTLSFSGQCGDSWYIVSGNATIPQTLKPGAVPFGGSKLNWDTGGSC